MTQRDWDMLTAWELGDPLADIRDWMLPPFTERDRDRASEWVKEFDAQG